MMQAGVMHDQATDPKFNVAMPEPVQRHFKHERTGINTALVEISAVAKLLIDKGVFTEQEYWQKLCEHMEHEVKRYEKLLTERLGMVVKLDSIYSDPVTGKKIV